MGDWLDDKKRERKKFTYLEDGPMPYVKKKLNERPERSDHKHTKRELVLVTAYDRGDHWWMSYSVADLCTICNRYSNLKWRVSEKELRRVFALHPIVWVSSNKLDDFELDTRSCSRNEAFNGPYRRSILRVLEDDGMVFAHNW